MGSRPIKTSVINVAGTLGYLSIIFQWLWTIILIGNPLLSSDLSYLLPLHDSPAPARVSTTPSPFVIVFVVALTIIVFAFTFYTVWKLPGVVGKSGNRVTKHTAAALIPVMTHSRKKPVTKKERQRLSYKIILLIKALLVIVPAVLLIWAHPIGGLGTDVIWVVGLFCAACSLGYFGLQQLLVWLWRVPAKDVW